MWGLEKGSDNLAWMRETGTGKRGSKLYVHRHGRGRAAAGDVPGVGPDASLVGLRWSADLGTGEVAGWKAWSC